MTRKIRKHGLEPAHVTMIGHAYHRPEVNQKHSPIAPEALQAGLCEPFSWLEQVPPVTAL